MTTDLITIHTAWQLVLESINRADTQLCLPGDTAPCLTLDRDGGWSLLRPATEASRDLLNLFMPLGRPRGSNAPARIVGQMGQSLDGRIATVTGMSRYINGEDGILHLHRLRAVSDAVIVGAGTASDDNPRLTVRLAPGANPVRVVIDRHRRVPASHHIFTDEQAPTLRLVAGEPTPGTRLVPRQGVLDVPCLGDGNEPVAPARIVSVLAQFGLHKLFVEGGGRTVSGFLEAGLLDHLHVMVAPMIIGSGRPAFTLPEIHNLSYAMRPHSQMVNLGSDMLFDLDFRSGKPSAP